MTAILLLLITIPVLAAWNVKKEEVRYHQHLEEPGYTPCTEHRDDVFCTHLPIVLVNTDGREIPGALTGETDRFGEALYTQTADGMDYLKGSVTVIDNAEVNNHLSDAPDFTMESLIRIRGHASRKFEKSPYLLKFVDDKGMDREMEVMGMDAHHEWALYGPYLDKSLVRNYMCCNLAGSIMDYAPNVRWCEVFLNGEYRGLYLMMETITNGKTGRLNLNEDYKGTEMEGYLLRIDRPTETDLETTRDIYSFTERTNMPLEDVAVRYPGKSRLTPELAHSIEMDFARFEKALYSYDYDTELYGYWNWVDVDNFADYYVINEFTRNVDAGIFSTYLYKEVGEKYKLCVWDFNNAFDNYIEREFDETGLTIYEKVFFNMMTRDEDFCEKIIDRYHELRESYLSDEYLFDYIDETIQWLGPAAERNCLRWASAYTDYAPLTPARRNVHSLDEAIAQLKTWIHRRGEWLDKNIDALRAVAHPSRNKEYNH